MGSISEANTNCNPRSVFSNEKLDPNKFLDLIEQYRETVKIYDDLTIPDYITMVMHRWEGKLS